MSDIIEEVDEAYAQDQAMRWWKRLSPIVYGLVAVLILGVAVNEFLQWRGSNAHKQEAEAFYTARTALESNDYALAEALFEEIAGSDSDYAELAGNYLAQTRLSGLGDKAAALEALKATAEGEGPLAEIARLKAGYLMADSSSLEELEAWLAPLSNSLSSPYAYLAQEVEAARAFSLGELETAEKRFNAIALALEVPQALRGRAERALIAIDAIQARNGTTQ